MKCISLNTTAYNRCKTDREVNPSDAENDFISDATAAIDDYISRITIAIDDWTTAETNAQNAYDLAMKTAIDAWNTNEAVAQSKYDTAMSLALSKWNAANDTAYAIYSTAYDNALSLTDTSLSLDGDDDLSFVCYIDPNVPAVPGNAPPAMTQKEIIDRMTELTTILKQKGIPPFSRTLTEDQKKDPDYQEYMALHQKLQGLDKPSAPSRAEQMLMEANSPERLAKLSALDEQHRRAASTRTLGDDLAKGVGNITSGTLQLMKDDITMLRNIIVNAYDSSRQSDETIAGSAMMAALMGIAEITGVAKLEEAYDGHEMWTERPLSSGERLSKAAFGSIQLVGSVFAGRATIARRQAGEATETRTALAARTATQATATPVRGRLQRPFDQQCFPADTPVATENGHHPISLIERGMKVWACNLGTGRWSLKTVLNTFSHAYEGDVITVGVAGTVFRATGNHPIWVAAGMGLDQRDQPEHVPALSATGSIRGRWVEARGLRVGDRLLLRDGEEAMVESLVVSQEALRVYNVEVADDHTYAVGTAEVLVHNKPLEFVNPPDFPVGKVGKPDNKWFRDRGLDAEVMKKEINAAGKHDIFKDRDGNLWVGLKDGSGEKQWIGRWVDE